MIAGARLPWELQWALYSISGRATETHQLLVNSHTDTHTHTTLQNAFLHQAREGILLCRQCVIIYVLSIYTSNT